MTKERSFVVTIQFEGSLNEEELEQYLTTALGNYVGDTPTMEYVDHDVYMEAEDLI